MTRTLTSRADCSPQKNSSDRVMYSVYREAEVVVEVAGEDIIQSHNLDPVLRNGADLGMERLVKLRDVLRILEKIRENAVLHVPLDRCTVSHNIAVLLYLVYHKTGESVKRVPPFYKHWERFALVSKNIIL